MTPRTLWKNGTVICNTLFVDMVLLMTCTTCDTPMGSASPLKHPGYQGMAFHALLPCHLLMVPWQYGVGIAWFDRTVHGKVIGRAKVRRGHMLGGRTKGYWKRYNKQCKKYKGSPPPHLSSPWPCSALPMLSHRRGGTYNDPISLEPNQEKYGVSIFSPAPLAGESCLSVKS